MASSQPAATPVSFNDDQLRVLHAIAEAFIPPLDDSELAALEKAQRTVSTADATATKKMAALSIADVPDYIQKVLDLLVVLATPDKVSQTGLVLTILSTRAGSLVLTGHFRPFYELS